MLEMTAKVLQETQSIEILCWRRLQREQKTTSCLPSAARRHVKKWPPITKHVKNRENRPTTSGLVPLPWKMAASGFLKGLWAIPPSIQKYN